MSHMLIDSNYICLCWWHGNCISITRKNFRHLSTEWQTGQEGMNSALMKIRLYQCFPGEARSKHSSVTRPYRYLQWHFKYPGVAFQSPCNIFILHVKEGVNIVIKAMMTLAAQQIVFQNSHEIIPHQGNNRCYIRPRKLMGISLKETTDRAQESLSNVSIEVYTVPYDIHPSQGTVILCRRT